MRYEQSEAFNRFIEQEKQARKELKSIAYGVTMLLILSMLGNLLAVQKIWELL
jgi:hypothetical protein